MSKEKDQGRHDDAKKSVEPVIQEETQKLVDEEAVAAELTEQRKEKDSETKEQTMAIKSAPVKHTKESFKKLIATYKEENPVKYALKKERLEARLESL